MTAAVSAVVVGLLWLAAVGWCVAGWLWCALRDARADVAGLRGALADRRRGSVRLRLSARDEERLWALIVGGLDRDAAGYPECEGFPSGDPR